MKKLIINRKQEFNNRARNFKIYLNGKYHSNLAHDETNKIITTELKTEINYIQFKIDWCSSQEVKLPFSNDDAESVIEVSSSMSNKLVLIVLIGLFINLLLFFFLKIKLFIIIAIIIFLIPGYKITFDRRNYLKIKIVK